MGVGLAVTSLVASQRLLPQLPARAAEVGCKVHSSFVGQRTGRFLKARLVEETQVSSKKHSCLFGGAPQRSGWVRMTVY